MSSLKHLPKSLPKVNPNFELEPTKGDLTGHEYKGDFECKISNLRIQGQIDKYFKFLNGGMDATLDNHILKLHKMAAYCKFTLVQCPEWFEESDYGLDLYDFNILEAVYDKIIEKEEEWLSGVWGKKEESEEKDNG